MLRWSCLVAAALVAVLCLMDAAWPPADGAWTGTTAIHEGNWDPATSADPIRLLMLSPVLLAGGVLLAGVRQRWLRRRQRGGLGQAAASKR